MKKISLLLLSFCLLFCLCACGTPTNSGNAEMPTSAQNETVSYKIGDEIFMDTDEGKYKLTITGVEETSERNQFWEAKPERVVLISYSYENISYSSDLYISDMNFKAYDKENMAMDTYPATVSYADSISAGRKTSGQMAYGLNSQENYMELEFYDNMFLGTGCKIVLEW